MRIEFYFTDNKVIEAHINPKKVLYFFVYEEEVTN